MCKRNFCLYTSCMHTRLRPGEPVTKCAEVKNSRFLAICKDSKNSLKNYDGLSEACMALVMRRLETFKTSQDAGGEWKPKEFKEEDSD
jgi:hypothetical protein